MGGVENPRVSCPWTRAASARLRRMLEPGTEAPAFSLPDQDGNVVNLEDLRGHWVLLWWYPKAATPG